MRVIAWCAGGVVFTLLATANGAGYRFGVSDQAFYLPALVHALQPDAFPRDAALIDAQARLMLTDEIIATLVRVSGASFETLFLAAYLLALGLMWLGLVLIGNQVYRSTWATVALGAALTLRHRIPRTSANTFEPYFHPRMLAFAIGLLAVSALLRRKTALAVFAIAGAALIHVTTALWFAILLGVALAVMDRRWRLVTIAGSAAVAVCLVLAAIVGPFQSAFERMDGVWLNAVASKDSLLPSDWPAWAWLANAAFPLILLASVRVRQRRGLATDQDRALLWSALALVAVFVLTLPLVIWHVAFFVQLQISRVFWLVNVLATVYAVAALTDRHRAAVTDHRPARLAAAILLVVSFGRGLYVLQVEHPERTLFATRLAETPWHDAMRWLGQQPMDVHVLANPGHAWKYGTSVRVAAARDVFLEDVKDSAIAIYSRDVAVRFVERAGVLGDFDSLTAADALALAARYDLDYLVTEASLPLPAAYRNRQFTIYALTGRAIASAR